MTRFFLAGCVVALITLADAFDIATHEHIAKHKLPTHSRCHTLCPNCTSPDCKCDGCWPGQSLTNTPDHTCDCFAELGFCDAGTQPVYTPGKKCPSCWAKENKACDCFASIGFCG